MFESLIWHYLREFKMSNEDNKICDCTAEDINCYRISLYGDPVEDCKGPVKWYAGIYPAEWYDKEPDGYPGWACHYHAEIELGCKSIMCPECQFKLKELPSPVQIKTTGGCMFHSPTEVIFIIEEPSDEAGNSFNKKELEIKIEMDKQTIQFNASIEDLKTFKAFVADILKDI